MIVCKNCNHENEDGSAFCGNCGSYLEWVGEEVAPVDRPLVEVTTSEEPAEEPGLIERLKDAVGLGDGSGAAVKQEASVVPPDARREAASVPGSSSARGSGDAATAPPAPPVTAAAQTGSATKSPPPAPPGAAVPPVPRTEEQLGPMQPQPEKQPSPKKGRRKPPAHARHGDLICGQCGEPNASDRRFCRRCGRSLAEAAKLELPWWRRLFPERQPLPAGGRAKAAQAEARPRRVKKGRLSFGGILRRLFALLIVVAIVAALVVPSFRTKAREVLASAFTSVKCLVVLCVEPVSVYDATATSALPDFPAKNLIDGDSATFWRAGDVSGQSQSLCLEFSEPIALRKVGIYLGPPQGERKEFLQFARPERVNLIPGKKVCEPGSLRRDRVGLFPVTLEDTSKEQIFNAKADDVRSLKILILTVRPPQKGGKNNVSIAEIEAFEAK